ncbi:MAG: hypothetical protein SNI70_05640 [Rikenellaceae bacterium]
MISKELKLIALCVVLAINVAFAQSTKPMIESHITPESVMIGDPFVLSIEIESDVMQQVAFPEFDFDGQSKIEKVNEPVIDTVKVDGRRIFLRRNYTLRSFDEGHYNLGRPSILYTDKNIVDTLYSADSLRITITTFLIDSTALANGIVDIKPQRDLPFKFAEISGYVKWGVLILLLFIALAYVVLRVLAHYGKNIGGFFKPAPPVPPHITAIKDLEKLHNKKLWQSNKHKQYYSMLTDILRTYISGRYSISAMEMTTDEIIEAIRDLEIPSKCAMDLQALLRDADLVKFAKMSFESEQNEGYYMKSYNFVEETKIVDEENTDEDNSAEKEKQSQEQTEGRA